MNIELLVSNGSLAANTFAHGILVSVRPVLYLKSNITLTGNGTNDENL